MPKVIPSAAAASEEDMTVTWENLTQYVNGELVSYSVTETVEDMAGHTTELREMDNTIVEDGRVLLVNRLVEDSSAIEDPEKVVKVTYVDHLLGEDGKGGSLVNHSELVLVFKARLKDLDVSSLNKVGATIASGSSVVSEADHDDVKPEAEGDKLVPGDPHSTSHDGFTFSGWTINRDQYGDYVMVAHHTKNTHVTYVDGQTGDTWGEKPGDRSHDGLKFVGWKEVTDVAGNTIYVAQYEPIAKTADDSTDTAKPDDTVKTNDAAKTDEATKTNNTTTPGAATTVSTASGTQSTAAPSQHLAKTGDTSLQAQVFELVLVAGGVLLSVGIRRRKAS